MDDNIATFNAITGASPDVARSFLEMTAGNFERAIELFYENPDLASGVGAGLSANTAPSTNPAPAAAAAARPNIGTLDSDGVIHIDSDEDEDMQFDDDSDNDIDNDRAVAAQAAALAQEEEDMAMAKRLQEELYQEPHGAGAASGSAMDDVRAPIARTTETLIAPGPSWGDGDGDVDAALLEQLRRRQQQQPARSGGPFSQQIWGDPQRHPTQATENGAGAHARRLEDLFRPPYDIMARMTWDEARTLGKEDKKWIMVNLQDMNDFNCQALNRDIWKDKSIRELVSENFIFLQYDKDFPDAQEYLTFYFTNGSHENPDNYPHVSIIDPRTGEQVKVWSGRPFPGASEFHAELAEFLDRYSLAANSKNPVAAATARKPQVVDVERMTEDEMLEMALKNSLESSANRGSSSTPNVHDPDALTKSDESTDEAEGKGKEPEQNPFALISGTSPHAEPENNPATTTRIQFRHPTGRVIRRFNLEDPVRRIYEWLKAEPLEGKDGIEFELKKMPQGQDLMESLNATIADTGLKQGTVMIEFIED
ncbi:hypothetical protein BGZ61DRAFT_441827 [Ilyonectria robusta]|uniref:uncharacterized protein n=1 Tax=Ilyonectria robusta TaxID=1079257 RepID=UPI001E8E4055|nr:uncharacterized protein BGZ61DRAFT_441827 [Ilyonectria robusta]KAH8736325.1 hypothetical protein BGZ61DRAFT_441827 [Ilyonectria robusta]